MAQQRVDKLKARGYDKAGIYNPQGSGRYARVYVLHRNDQPELYPICRKIRRSIPPINLWKGALKPLSAAEASLHACRA